MERDEFTFEEAQIAGAKRLEKFIRYALGGNVEVVNTFDKPTSEKDDELENTSLL